MVGSDLSFEYLPAQGEVVVSMRPVSVFAKGPTVTDVDELRRLLRGP
ncbi:hypothetical protein [Nocardia terpenica]|nr:hypothetical protein [Nocardia terpenica]NQE92402.1 hypothetical protein [Nocardia terpenica]